MLDLLDEFEKLMRALEVAGIDYALCGGLALAVYGIPRATIDIDLLVRKESEASVKSVAHACGYLLEAAPMSFKGGEVEIRRVTKIDPGSGDTLMLDLVLVAPATENVWAARRRVDWDRGTVWVVDRAGLIQLKRQRQSGQDMDDIARLLELADER